MPEAEWERGRELEAPSSTGPHGNATEVATPHGPCDSGGAEQLIWVMSERRSFNVDVNSDKHI